MRENKPKTLPCFRRIADLVGAGMHLLLFGLFVEGLTLVARQWVSFPITIPVQAQVVLTVTCIAVCLLGMVWFNRSLDLIRVHLLNGKPELITRGPFSYVRHPLYATLLITIPPLLIIWLLDLLFFIPWALVFVAAHYVVRIEERGLTDVFGLQYETYRQLVPALLPYKGAAGQRFREAFDDSEPKR